MITFNRAVSLLIAALVAVCFTLANVDAARADMVHLHTAAGGTLTLNRHDVVIFNRSTSCPTEDTLAGPCTWNVNAGDGNGQGAAFWVSRSGVRHFVWTSDPTVNGWHWLDLWATCVYRVKDNGHGQWKCPTGDRGPFVEGVTP